MTATADITHSKAAPVGTHRFAYPVVREIPSRRNRVATQAPTGGDQTGDGLVALVHAARRGNPAAWTALVERFDPALRKTARGYRLSTHDVEDVVQETWALLYAHIGRLREPAAVAGWLATTVRRQALRLLQAQTRERLTDDPDLGESPELTPEAVVLADERHAVFMRAVRTLPERQRRVVTLLMAQPNLDYQQLGDLLEMPVGSIGPTRARGLARLERDTELRHLRLVS